MTFARLRRGSPAGLAGRMEVALSQDLTCRLDTDTPHFRHHPGHPLDHHFMRDLTSVPMLSGSPYKKIRPATADTSLERKIKSIRETVDFFSSPPGNDRK